MEIVSRRRKVRVTEVVHEYRWDDGSTAGFSFPVNEVGEEVAGNPAARTNLDMCRRGTGEDGTRILDLGLQERHHSYTLPAVGRCEACGQEVTLDGFTNTCVCGADYNSSGQRLAPRSQWGEETGESLGEILRIP